MSNSNSPEMNLIYLIFLLMNIFLMCISTSNKKSKNKKTKSIKTDGGTSIKTLLFLIFLYLFGNLCQQL